MYTREHVCTVLFHPFLHLCKLDLCLHTKLLDKNLGCSIYFILIFFSLIPKQAIFSNVHHAWIRSWNQPVFSNEGKFLAQGNNGGLWWGLTHDWQASTNYQSDAPPTAPSHPMSYLIGNLLKVAVIHQQC